MDRAPPPLIFVVSDLHLGNEYFFHDNFLSWLEDLPEGAGLVLNGDIIDSPGAALEGEHRQVLERLVAESYSRLVVWVYGNHDWDVELEDSGQIQFAPHWEIERRLLILHGDRLDDLMPRHSIFKSTFKLLHRAGVFVGFPDVHVAKYAKKWDFLYRVLNEHVARKAVKRAVHFGFAAVACGHTHASMDMVRDGTRYLNTGAWTEEPHYYLAVTGTEINLFSYQGTATTPN